MVIEENRGRIDTRAPILGEDDRRTTTCRQKTRLQTTSPQQARDRFRAFAHRRVGFRGDTRDGDHLRNSLSARAARPRHSYLRK
jgi:hypothetical protein